MAVIGDGDYVRERIVPRPRSALLGAFGSAVSLATFGSVRRIFESLIAVAGGGPIWTVATSITDMAPTRAFLGPA